MKTQKLITLLSIAGLLCSTSSVFSQTNMNNNSQPPLPSNTDAFGKGTNVINVGVGIGGAYTYIGNGYSSTPNIVISYENGTFDKVGPGIISLGGILSYKGASYNYNDGYGYYYNQSWAYFILGLRSAYHWNFTTNGKFDPYAGLMLAYNDVTYKETTNNAYYTQGSYGSYLGLTLYIGARYYLSNNIGLWLELGYGYTNAAFGVSFKF